jgi:L-malate glycosyltransferase
MTSRFLLSGYYGLGNAGDEAVLAAILQTLAETEGPAPIVEVLSADPAGTTALHGVPSSPRMNPRAVFAALRRTEALISGGGSLLQDTTSLRSLWYYLAAIRLAHLLRRPVVVYAQGLGPLLRSSARRATAIALRRCAVLTFRDEESARLARELVGPGGPPITVTADPVFALRPDPSAPRSSADLLVSLRPWPTAPELEATVRRVLRPLGREGLQIEFLAMQPSADGPLAAALAAAVPGAASFTASPHPSALMARLGGARAILAMRLHALIFAAAQARPVAGISYDPKLDAAIAQVSAVAVGSADALSPDVLSAAVARLLDIASDATANAERERIARTLAHRARETARLARLAGRP